MLQVLLILTKPVVQKYQTRVKLRANISRQTIEKKIQIGQKFRHISNMTIWLKIAIF